MVPSKAAMSQRRACVPFASQIVRAVAGVKLAVILCYVPEAFSKPLEHSATPATHCVQKNPDFRRAPPREQKVNGARVRAPNSRAWKACAGR